MSLFLNIILFFIHAWVGYGAMWIADAPDSGFVGYILVTASFFGALSSVIAITKLLNNKKGYTKWFYFSAAMILPFFIYIAIAIISS